MSLGIVVRLLYSTAEAMDWISRNSGTSWISLKTNAELVQTNNKGDKLRIITDLARWENGIFKSRAGEEFVQYFKNKDIAFKEIPILVCTSAVAHTAFVEDFPFTSSTKSHVVVRQYIDGLAKGEIWNPVHRWMMK